MKNSEKIKEIFIHLAANDKLPLNLDDLNESIFDEFNAPELSNSLSVEQAKEALRNAGYILLHWHHDDVRNEAKKMDIELTDAQVLNISSYIENKNDCNVGVDYDFVQQAISDVVFNYTIVKESGEMHYDTSEEKFYGDQWLRTNDSENHLKMLMQNNPDKFEGCKIESNH